MAKKYVWYCEACKEEFDEDIQAVDVTFGNVDCRDKNVMDQIDAFETDNSWGPLCDNCAVKFIRGEIG